MLSPQQLQTVQTITYAPVRELPMYPSYFVSNTGQVISLKTDPPRELQGVIHPTGYRRVCLSIEGNPVQIFVHRLVALAFLPPPNFSKAIVRHLDGNPANNHVANLAWGTPQDNSDDMRRHGRAANGSRNGISKLKDEQVQQIREYLAEGRPLRSIGRQFGVSSSAIWKISQGKTWGTVP